MLSNFEQALAENEYYDFIKKVYRIGQISPTQKMFRMIGFNGTYMGNDFIETKTSSSTLFKLNVGHPLYSFPVLKS